MKVSIVGASGYVGGELIRLLDAHPAVSELTAISDSWQGKPVHAAHPQLLGKCSLDFQALSADNLLGYDAVFFATPPLVAASMAAALAEADKLIIDCSPDFRLRDLACWKSIYGSEHPASQLIAQAAYGLPELFRERIQGTKLIAVPGCYATCVQLAAAPIAAELAKAGCKDVHIAACGMSGTSGAGRRKDRSELLLAEAGNNASAYSLSGHRHAPEILQGIQDYAGIEATLSFVPHLIPVPRGMIATVQVIADGKPVGGNHLHNALEQAYGDEPCITVLPAGESPQLVSVLHENRAVIGTTAGDGPGAVICAVDNLVKGAAGQAVQCFSLHAKAQAT